MSWKPLGREGCRHLRVESSREWKEIKRAELRKVMKSIDDLYLGCAYTPAIHNIQLIRDQLEVTKSKLSQSEWGR